MDSSPEENFPSDTETAIGQHVTKRAKVTAPIFYKRTSSVPAAKSSSGHTSRPPSRESNVEAETVAENQPAIITDFEVALSVQPEGSETHIDSIMHVSPARSDVSIAIAEEEVPWSSIAAGPEKSFSPILFDFVHDIDDDDYEGSPSPPSSSVPIVAMDTASHAKVTSKSTSLTASKSTPLPENPSPAAKPSVSKNRKSNIWEHFVTVGDGRLAKCKLCGKDVSRGKNLGHLTNAGMHNHMRTHHKAVLLREESGLASPASKGQGSTSASPSSTISSATDNMEKGQKTQAVVNPSKGNQSTIEHFSGFHPRGMSRQQSRKITRLIGELIAVGGAPFNMVEGEPFKRLLKALAPQYVVPARTTFSRSVVPALYKSCVDLLKEELGKAAGQSVHLTTDLWSAPSGQHAFLSLTAHWWQPIVPELSQATSGPRSTGADNTNQGHRSFLLHAEVLDEKHTSENITRAIKKMVEEWLGEHRDTRPKLGLVVSDGAANMIKALRDGHFVGVRCSAHVLHLVVKHALEETSESATKLTGVLESCRKIAGHFHRSVRDSHIDIDDDYYQESPSPPSSSGSLVVMDTASHAKTATVISKMPSATASKSTPLPENPSPSAQPSVSCNRKPKVWEHFASVGDGHLYTFEIGGSPLSLNFPKPTSGSKRTAGEDG